jgi:hypothetical protein
MRPLGTIFKLCVSTVLLFFMVGLGQNSASGQSAGSPLYTSMDNHSVLDVQGIISLTDALSEIENDYDVSFLYNSKLLEGKLVESSILKSDSLAYMLSELLIRKGLSYRKETDRTYVIMPKSEPAEQKAALETVSGTVTDSQSGDLVLAASFPWPPSPHTPEVTGRDRCGFPPANRRLLDPRDPTRPVGRPSRPRMRQRVARRGHDRLPFPCQALNGLHRVRERSFTRGLLCSPAAVVTRLGQREACSRRRLAMRSCRISFVPSPMIRSGVSR